MLLSFYPLAFILLVSFTCLSAQAYGVSNKTVAKVHVNGSSGFYFKTHEPMKNPSNCANDSWYRIDMSLTYAREMLSILMMARASNKKVSLNLDGCSNGYPKATWINTHD